MRFKFKFKRRLLWKTEIVSGFGYDKEKDRMQLYYEDGSIYEISKWSKYDCKLGRDYFDVLKKQMEGKTGQSIPTKEVR